MQTKPYADKFEVNGQYYISFQSEDRTSKSLIMIDRDGNIIDVCLGISSQMISTFKKSNRVSWFDEIHQDTRQFRNLDSIYYINYIIYIGKDRKEHENRKHANKATCKEHNKLRIYVSRDTRNAIACAKVVNYSNYLASYLYHRLCDRICHDIIETEDGGLILDLRIETVKFTRCERELNNLPVFSF